MTIAYRSTSFLFLCPGFLTAFLSFCSDSCPIVFTHSGFNKSQQFSSRIGTHTIVHLYRDGELLGILPDMRSSLQLSCEG
jgi:hypothetical protein